MLSVPTPASSFRLATVDAVKLELGIDGSADDEWIGRRIDIASSQAASYCNRVFARETVTETFRNYRSIMIPGIDPEPLRMTRIPVISVASVTENEEAVAAANYEYDDATGLMWRLDDDGGRIAWEEGKIVVAYTGGYNLPGDTSNSLPADVEAAVIEMVKASYFARLRDPLIKSEYAPDVGKVEYWVGSTNDVAPGVPDTAAALLGPYVILAI